MVVFQNGWFIMENPTKYWWFRDTPIAGNLHLSMSVYCHIGSHHGDLLFDHCDCTRHLLVMSKCSMNPILRTPPLRGRARQIGHNGLKIWCPQHSMIDHCPKRNCHFRVNPMFGHTQILSISCCWLYPTCTAFLYRQYIIPSISKSLVGDYRDYIPWDPYCWCSKSLLLMINILLVDGSNSRYGIN